LNPYIFYLCFQPLHIFLTKQYQFNCETGAWFFRHNWRQRCPFSQERKKNIFNFFCNFVLFYG
jgi:hypothetical protein